MSKGPASVPTRAPASRSRPPARSASPPASERRVRGISHDADAGVAALLAQTWLLLLDEVVVADQPERVLEQRAIVAAVVDEGREILVDDVVVVREGVRGQEVAAGDLVDVQLQLAGGQIEQALDDEHAVLAAGAAIGGHDGLVGEDGGEFAGVVGNLGWAEQGALAFDRDGTAVVLGGRG